MRSARDETTVPGPSNAARGGGGITKCSTARASGATVVRVLCGRIWQQNDTALPVAHTSIPGIRASWRGVWARTFQGWLASTSPRHSVMMRWYSGTEPGESLLNSVLAVRTPEYWVEQAFRRKQFRPRTTTQTVYIIAHRAHALHPLVLGGRDSASIAIAYMHILCMTCTWCVCVCECVQIYCTIERVRLLPVCTHARTPTPLRLRIIIKIW